MDFSRKRALRNGIIHAFHSKKAKMHGLLLEIVLPDPEMSMHFTRKKLKCMDISQNKPHNPKKILVLAGGKARSAPFCLLSAQCHWAEGLSQGGNRVDAAHGCALDCTGELWHPSTRTALLERGCYRGGFGNFVEVERQIATANTSLWGRKTLCRLERAKAECYFLRRCFLLWVGEPVLTPLPERDESEFRESEFSGPELREFGFREFELRELAPCVRREPALRPLPLPRSGGTRHSGP